LVSKNHQRTSHWQVGFLSLPSSYPLPAHKSGDLASLLGVDIHTSFLPHHTQATQAVAHLEHQVTNS
jgi:hypothetical protein